MGIWNQWWIMDIWHDLRWFQCPQTQKHFIDYLCCMKNKYNMFSSRLFRMPQFHLFLSVLKAFFHPLLSIIIYTDIFLIFQMVNFEKEFKIVQKYNETEHQKNGNGESSDKSVIAESSFGGRTNGVLLGPKTPINIMKCYNNIILMMRLPQPAQLQKRVTTLNSFGSLQVLEERMSEERMEMIPSLLTKFVHLSSKIEIQHNISSFNLIDYEKEDSKVKQDHHTAAARLKRIENNAELKRANMELFMRKRKIQKIKEERNQEAFQHQREGDGREDHYQNIFRTFAEGQAANKLQEGNDSAEQEDGYKASPEEPKTPPPPEGILYFDELKKHPRLLSYTLQKVKEKNQKSDREKYEKRDRILKFRNQMRTISHSEPRMTNKDKLPTPPPENDQFQPQVIFQNIFRKIYTKKNHNRSRSEMHKDERLATFMHKQEEILEGVNEKSLSKQNYKRLKERFGDLLNELYQLDRKHRIQEKYQKKLNCTFDPFRRSPLLS